MELFTTTVIPIIDSLAKLNYLLQLYFQMSSMFSTQSVYDSMFLTLYNVVYTAFPILVIALTEKVYSEERLMT